MFRLANFDDENIDEGGLFRYISRAVSVTIADCLDKYIEDLEEYRVFYNSFFFEDGFFTGFSAYYRPKTVVPKTYGPDDRAGYEFIYSKMKRMKEKMLDQDELYTFLIYDPKHIEICYRWIYRRK